jgi:hypothetical protein
MTTLGIDLCASIRVRRHGVWGSERPGTQDPDAIHDQRPNEPVVLED